MAHLNQTFGKTVNNRFTKFYLSEQSSEHAQPWIHKTFPECKDQGFKKCPTDACWRWEESGLSCDQLQSTLEWFSICEDTKGLRFAVHAQSKAYIQSLIVDSSLGTVNIWGVSSSAINFSFLVASRKCKWLEHTHRVDYNWSRVRSHTSRMALIRGGYRGHRFFSQHDIVDQHS